MTTWSSPTKHTSNWTSPNRSTVEQHILIEDGFDLLLEDGFVLLQENDAPDWGGLVKSTTNWGSPIKN